MLHVALDLRLTNHSGIGSYLKGLLSGFAEINAEVEWTFVGKECEIPAALRVRKWIPFDAPLYSRREFFGYPDVRDADVFHYPHYNLPRVRARRKVVTVYDLFHLLYGTFAKRQYQKLFLHRLALSGAPIATISQKSREDILRWSWISPERVSVIDLGPGRPAPAERPQPRPLEMQNGKTLRPPWLLAVGIDQPHKNMDFLIAAYAMWNLRRDGVPPLVWAGPSAEAITRRLPRIPAHAREKIFLEPYADVERIESLYAGAAALVFPSLDEGFGLPPLEAMARGVPVLCARRRPMLDHLGSAPIWFDPADSATLWRALDQLIDDPAAAKETAQRGRAQAAKFGWRRCAEETLELYTAAAGGTVKQGEDR